MNGLPILLLLIIPCLLPSCSPERPDRAALETYAKAKSLYLERRGDEALPLLQELDFEALPAAGLLLGKVLFFKGAEAEAERVLGKIVEKRPDYEEARKWLARLLMLRGRPKEAEKCLAEGLALDSEDSELLALMGKARLGNKDIAGAMQYFLKAESSLERLAEAPLELADLYRGLGMREKSLVRLELALALLGRESALRRTVDAAAAELRKELKK